MKNQIKMWFIWTNELNYTMTNYIVESTYLIIIHKLLILKFMYTSSSVSVGLLLDAIIKSSQLFNHSFEKFEKNK